MSRLATIGTILFIAGIAICFALSYAIVRLASSTGASDPKVIAFGLYGLAGAISIIVSYWEARTKPVFGVITAAACCYTLAVFFDALARLQGM